jgi:hypothetical protein
VPEQRWDAVLAVSLIEVASVLHAAQLFERRSYVEKWLRELGCLYDALFEPGWVELNSALLLYWLVRRLKPRTTVQTGVYNGLSSAFMMLGLVKNGPEGRLHAIDLPTVFDPRDAGWAIAGKIYPCVIPEGRTSGWLTPDVYLRRLDVQQGDGKDLLPVMIEQLDSLDLFFHDSDQTYHHMMFQFHQVKRKLNKGGLVSADVAWNASMRDFADEFDVPSYNYKGSLGMTFF